MFVKTEFRDLVNLDYVVMFYVAEDGDQSALWAIMASGEDQKMHEGTVEQCQSAFDEIFQRLRMHNGDGFEVMTKGVVGNEQASE